MTPGLASVAAVVRDHNGHPVAGVAVTFAEGTSERLSGPVIATARSLTGTARGRNRGVTDAAATTLSHTRPSSEGASMSSPERRSRRRLVWSGTVAAAVVASALTIPTSGAGVRHGEPRRDQRGAEGIARHPAPGPAGHPAAHPQRPGDQEPDLARRRGRPQRPGPDHRGRAHRGRGVRRERASAPRPAADEGTAPHSREGAADAVRHGQRLLLARRPADLLQADDARRLPALRQAAPLRRRRWRPRGRAQPGDRVDRPQGRRPVHVHQRRQRLRINGTERFALARHQGLHPLPRGRHQHPRGAVRGRHAVPGGARVRRRAHPRDGLRVPRRRGALRPALARVRRAVRAAWTARTTRSRRATARSSRRSSPDRRATTRSAGRRSRTGRRPTR